MKRNIIILFTLLLGLSACGGSNSQKEVFNEDEMLRNVYQQIIKVEEETFLKDALALQEATDVFVQSPNADKLSALRTQWLVVAKDWARCFTFNIGPMRGRTQNFFFLNARFPINANGIEGRIEKAGLEEINTQYVLSFGNDMKGLYGIEYLLYKDDVDKSLQAYSSEKRRKVLKLVVAEFVSDVRSHKEAWDKYSLTFLANKIDKDDIDNSFNQLIGGLDNVIHFAWETKVGKAIRKNDIEAPYSRKSLDLIRENIAMTKKLYFEGGIAEKVKAAMKGHNTFNESVRKRYEKVEKALDAIGEPLILAIKGSEKSKVEYLLEELKALENIELTKVETTLNLIDGTKEGDGD